LWQKDLRARYGWLTIIASLGLFWTAVALAPAGAWWWRRRRDRVRRAALDDGWPEPLEEEVPNA
jgi:hypothetical protein